jgi:hypothetical protein
MSKHILGVDVIPTNNVNILHLFDTSVYAEGLGKTCLYLEITLPGFKEVRLVEPNPNFNLSLNAITLSLIPQDADYLSPLPDGVYHIRYSVAPNDKVWVELDHLRTTSFDQQMFEQRCDIKLNACSPMEEVTEQLKQLQEVDNYLKAAIAKVEICDEVSKGIELFTYAKRLLDRQTNHC